MHAHHRIAALLLVGLAAVAGVVATKAHAASLQDLRDLGYEITRIGANPSGPDCSNYRISGYGISTDFSGCDQAAIDKLANPVAHCNRKWQYEHPEQLAAVNSIRMKRWGVTGEQCADVYVVTNPATPWVAAYRGAASGLAAFNSALAQAVGTPVDPANQSWWCLPLCATPVAPAAPAITTTATAPVVPPPPTETVVQTVTVTVEAPAPPPIVLPAAACVADTLAPRRRAGRAMPD